MKKGGIIFGLGLCLILLAGCGSQKTDEEALSEFLTSDFASGLLQDAPQTTGTDHQTPVQQKTELKPQVSGSLAFSQQVATGGLQLSGGQAPNISKKTKKSLFPVAECNAIVKFNLCLISKAPVENQKPMKQELAKVLEPRKILADPQLKEVCQEVVAQESFLGVVEHYKEQGCTL